MPKVKLSNYLVAVPAAAGLALFNTRNRGLVLLDSECKKAFYEMDLSKERDLTDFENQLYAAEFLLDDSRDEFAEVLEQSERARMRTDVLQLTIAPTTLCNFSCPYCFEQGAESLTMTQAIAEQLVDFIDQKLKGVKKVYVTWYGGEPLLSFDLIESITKQIMNLLPDDDCYQASMVTNGYLLTPDIVRKLSRNNITNIQVTLDGSAATHNMRRRLKSGGETYASIVDNISHAAHVAHITVRVNVDASNQESAFDLLEDLKNRGLDSSIGEISVAMVDNVGGAFSGDNDCLTTSQYTPVEAAFYRKAIDLGFKVPLLGRFAPVSCSAITRYAFLIDPSGRLYRCWNDVGKPDRSEATISDQGRRSPSAWDEYRPRREFCGDCPVFPICLGGCPAAAMQGRRTCDSVKYNIKQQVELKLYECGFA